MESFLCTHQGNFHFPLTVLILFLRWLSAKLAMLLMSCLHEFKQPNVNLL